MSDPRDLRPWHAAVDRRLLAHLLRPARRAALPAWTRRLLARMHAAPLPLLADWQRRWDLEATTSERPTVVATPAPDAHAEPRPGATHAPAPPVAPVVIVSSGHVLKHMSKNTDTGGPATATAMPAAPPLAAPAGTTPGPASPTQPAEAAVPRMTASVRPLAAAAPTPPSPTTQSAVLATARPSVHPTTPAAAAATTRPSFTPPTPSAVPDPPAATPMPVDRRPVLEPVSSRTNALPRTAAPLATRLPDPEASAPAPRPGVRAEVPGDPQAPTIRPGPAARLSASPAREQRPEPARPVVSTHTIEHVVEDRSVRAAELARPTSTQRTAPEPPPPARAQPLGPRDVDLRKIVEAVQRRLVREGVWERDRRGRG